MVIKSLLSALVLGTALAFGCAAASGQTPVVRPDMPPGFDEVEQLMAVPGTDLISYVYKNKATGEERRVLATPKGAIRRYLVGPPQPDDVNYTWIHLPDVPCNCGGSHQFPVPNPDPGSDGDAFNPGIPVGKQGWNYGLGIPKEGEPPDEFKSTRVEKPEDKSLKTEQETISPSDRSAGPSSVAPSTPSATSNFSTQTLKDSKPESNSPKQDGARKTGTLPKSSTSARTDEPQSPAASSKRTSKTQDQANVKVDVIVAPGTGKRTATEKGRNRATERGSDRSNESGAGFGSGGAFGGGGGFGSGGFGR